MFLNYFDNTFYVDRLYAVLMNWNNKNDVQFPEYMMAPRDSVEVEALGLKQFPNVCKRDVEWTLLQLYEKFLTFAHNLLFSLSLNHGIRRHYLLKDAVALLTDLSNTRPWVVANEGRRRHECVDLERNALHLQAMGDYL